jgi:tape measure domain-containing protein
MADLSQTIAIVFQGKDNASDEIAKVERGLAGVDKAGKGALEVSDQLGGIAGKVGSIGTAIATAFGALAVGTLAAQFLEANTQVERFTRAVSQIAGGSEAANRELAYLREVSDRLGLSVADTSGAYLSLLAATRGTALEGAETRRIFEAVAGAMANLGRSSADTEGALLAVQQMISKGKVSAEELRGQLGERLPGAFAIAAKAAGTTTEGLNDLLESGQLLAEDFLPAFARELQSAFGSTQPVDGYTAAVNRLKNAFDEALIALGQSGVFDALTSTLQGAAKFAQSLGGGLEYLGTTLRATYNLARGGSFDVFSAEMDLAADRADKVSQSLVGGLNQSLAETARLTRQAGEATSGYDAEMAKLERQAGAQTAALKETAEAFKTLGVSPEKAKVGVEQLLAAFDTLSKAGSVNGNQLLAGLEAALKRIDDKKYLPTLQEDLKAAFEGGRISVEQYVAGVKQINEAFVKLDKGANGTADALKKQAAEAKKAEEAQERLRLELEKLASNERIKLIEARVQLNVTEVQEQTKRIQAAFESLDNTVNSTAEVISKAFGVLGDQTSKPWIDNELRNKLFDQIDRENGFRERALKTQEELTQAQIDLLRQQARQIERGDALIKIDGTGLEPHIEAFMFEILKKLQVTTTRDGLKILLGMT